MIGYSCGLEYSQQPCNMCKQMGLLKNTFSYGTLIMEIAVGFKGMIYMSHVHTKQKSQLPAKISNGM